MIPELHGQRQILQRDPIHTTNEMFTILSYNDLSKVFIALYCT